MAHRSVSSRLAQLLWASLAFTVALPVHAAERLAGPPLQARAAWLAQAKGEIPAQVQGWVDEAVAAYKKGNPAEALRLQQQALEWVKARLAPAHPFRAKVLNNLSVFLSAVGRQQEALAPTEEAVKVYQELAKTNQADLSDLAGPLSNQGDSHNDLRKTLTTYVRQIAITEAILASPDHLPLGLCCQDSP